MGIRIIAGKAKGQTIPSPRNKRLRPTSQRVKGAMFSLIDYMQIEGSMVLDLYAGTGALGFEAISRGASVTDFVDWDPRLCASIRDILATAGLESESRVYCMLVEVALSKLVNTYDLVLMDPPYDNPFVEDIMMQLSQSSIMNERGLAVIEHSKRTLMSKFYNDLTRMKTRRYGDSCVSVYMRGG